MSLSLSQRQDNAREHACALSELLNRPAVKGMGQRIYRARLWMEMAPADIISEASHEFLVITLVQDIVRSGVKVYVTRPFTNPMGAMPTTKLELSGAYSVDEIVAFLTLDRVPVEHVAWVDESKSDILVSQG